MMEKCCVNPIYSNFQMTEKLSILLRLLMKCLAFLNGSTLSYSHINLNPHVLHSIKFILLCVRFHRTMQLSSLPAVEINFNTHDK